MRQVHVESVDLPALRPYRTLRRFEDHRTEGIFVAEGEKVVRRLLASGIRVVSLLLSPTWAQRLAGTPIPDNVTWYIADDRLLRTITGAKMHQSIMAVGTIPPEPPDFGTSFPQPRLLAALDGLAHAENVGVTVRNCTAFGVQGILSGETSCSPWVRRAVRNSMGSVFRTPVVHPPDLCLALRHLRDHLGIDVVVTDAHEGQPVDTVDFRHDVCLVFGEEQSGVSPEIAALATATARIPMAQGIDSLNVSSASAVALYEVRRQRQRRSDRTA